MPQRRTLPLFRPEVIDSYANRKYGDISIGTPPLAKWFVAAALLILLLSMCFLYFGRYTRHETILGVIEPTAGVLKVYAPQAGKVKRTLVRVGDRVHRGDVLVTFSAERSGPQGRSFQKELEAQMVDRLQLLKQEVEGGNSLASVEADELLETISADKARMATLTEQIGLLRGRIENAKLLQVKYRELANSGFFSEIQYEEKIDEFVDQQLRLSEMEKQQSALRLEIQRQLDERLAAPLRHKVAMAEVERSISSAQSDLSKAREDVEWSVVSPDEGQVSSIASVENQTVDANSALLAITPLNSNLRIRSFAPSKSVGLLRVGQEVKIKFDSFPYQRFGIFNGTIDEIAKSPVLLKELPQGSRVGDAILDAPEGSSGLYAVIISMNFQDLGPYIKAKDIQPGFQLTAEVQLESRRLFEWIFNPLDGIR